MVKRVQEITMNPLEAAQREEERELFAELEEKKLAEEGVGVVERKKEEMMETRILE